MKIDEFKYELEKLNIIVTQKQLDDLEKYYTFLSEYNSHTNLTAIIDKEDVYLKHFYDSLTIVNAVNLNEITNIVDIGSGAGFPGIVLKIFFPHLKLTTIDSNGKKTNFIHELVKKLELDNVSVVHGRAEEYVKDRMNSYDLCVSRAVAFIDIITELSMPYIKCNGKIILMKGNIDNEKEILANYHQQLNIQNYEIINLKLPKINDERNLIVISKKNETIKLLNYSQIIKRNKKWNTSK